MQHSIFDILFGFVFLSQVFFISFYLAKKTLDKMLMIVIKYPPKEYPRLYPGPLKYYQKALAYYQYINFSILIIGLVLFVTWVNGALDNTIAMPWPMGYFLLQIFPVFLVNTAMFKQYKLMRKSDSRTSRTAKLQPRRLLDVIPTKLTLAAALMYLALILQKIYLEQSGTYGFDNYMFILQITFGNLIFISVILLRVYRKKEDPYQSYEDWKNQTKLIAKQMAFLSITLTLLMNLLMILNLISSITTLSPSFISHFMNIAMSLYFQVIAGISFQASIFQSLHIDEANSDIYKEAPLIT